jgi:hypothetical protein
MTGPHTLHGKRASPFSEPSERRPGATASFRRVRSPPIGACRTILERRCHGPGRSRSAMPLVFGWDLALCAASVSSSTRVPAISLAL